TGYGYVKVGEKISDGKAYELESFKEKPDKPTAEKFMEEGGYFWNTGLYVFKAKTMLEFFKEFQKDSYSKFMEISKHLGGETQDETILKIYPTLEKISIDYAIVEKVPKERVRIISANLNWTDIGNFETIYNALAKSRNENITRGNIKTLDAEGCLIYSDTERKTAVSGLKDIVVVDTKDGLLICKKDQSKRVKEIH
ncbi:mannose-1-phosphate guanylyltransferase, partial [Candidatus Peregrinibacteria bacterium]|nr:mannose-1-phosphate guanylyltransferase [Candidatus Peregrinibacteria bacterium]